MRTGNTFLAIGLVAAGMAGLLVLFAGILLLDWTIPFPASLIGGIFSLLIGTGCGLYFYPVIGRGAEDGQTEDS